MKPIDPQSLSGLHLFYNPYSNCAQRVMLLIEEKGLKPTLHSIDLMGSEQLSEAYIAINPKGEVPAIVHNGTSMHESVEIMKYLEATFPSPSFTPENPREKERMDRFLETAAASHETGVVNFVYSAGFGRLPTPRDWTFYKKNIPHRTKFHEERLKGKAGSDLEAAKAVLRQQFSALEDALKENVWLAGDTYSLADMAWYPNTIILRQLGYSFKAFPSVVHWIERIEQRPAYKQGIKARQTKVPFFVIRLALRFLRKRGGRY